MSLQHLSFSLVKYVIIDLTADVWMEFTIIITIISHWPSEYDGCIQ